jgi:aryl-alcohol dehydrogenase-like predicted oxidoreductase
MFAGKGHFRPLPTQNEACGGDLTVSSLGLGTYLGPETEAADQQYIESITRALSVGINVLDT